MAGCEGLIASSTPWVVSGASVLVLTLVVIYRWLYLLTKRVNDHAERISWLEAKVNGKPK
jgi:hypothetical protein